MERNFFIVRNQMVNLTQYKATTVDYKFEFFTITKSEAFLSESDRSEVTQHKLIFFKNYPQ